MNESSQQKSLARFPTDKWTSVFSSRASPFHFLSRFVDARHFVCDQHSFRFTLSEMNNPCRATSIEFVLFLETLLCFESIMLRYLNFLLCEFWRDISRRFDVDQQNIFVIFSGLTSSNEYVSLLEINLNTFFTFKAEFVVSKYSEVMFQEDCSVHQFTNFFKSFCAGCFTA